MNNDNEYNIKLYNSVFNNVYLKRIILNHLTIFNILYINIVFKSLEELKLFKYKEYLNSITLGFDDYDYSNIPENITHLNIKSPYNHYSEIKCIPDSIKSINLLKLEQFHLKSQFIKSINLKSKSTPVITQLEFDYKNIYHNLSELISPNKINKLIIKNTESIENNTLPESLNQICIKYSDPLIAHQFNQLEQLVKLELDVSQREIENCLVLPNTLQELVISCDSFESKLPIGLKSFRITMKRFIYEIIFPSSLENLEVTVLNKSNLMVFKDHQSIPSSLKSIKYYFPNFTDSYSILPDTLEKYVIGGANHEIKVNQLPSSLTYLELGGQFNSEINELPSNLNTLIFNSYYYNKVINPLVLPKELKHLQISPFNITYSYPINLVSTHPNTVVSCNDLNLYYDSSNTSIRVLRLPNRFNSSLSTLKLQDKSSLEYLHLGELFNQPIQLSDLPTINNIKTLELNVFYNQTINLELFQNLETIIIDGQITVNTFLLYTPRLNLTTTTYNNNNKIKYNNYKLKHIILDSKYNEFIKCLDPNFYQFIKYKRPNNK